MNGSDTKGFFLCTLIAYAALCSAADAGNASPASAVSRAKEYVLSRLDPKTGRCLDEYDESSPRYGGMTALCVYALLSAGCDDQKTPVLQTSIRWLGQAKLHGTYAVALRAAALAAIKDQRVRKKLQEDVTWLLDAAWPDGSYTHTSTEGQTPSSEKSGAPFDNTNSQWAVLGVYSGLQRGLSVPAEYWRRVEKHWRAQQQPDGGWGYCARSRNGKLYARPYGSMTAAGVATLAICRDQLARANIVAGLSTPPSEAMKRGLAWLEKNFSADSNPRKNAEWYYFWLFSLQRVGEATGQKYLAGVNWYAEAARRLRRRQNPDGSWGYGPRTAETCFAMIFLARGEAPILLNKMRYDGAWNTRPRDAAGLTRWLSYAYERPLGWQVLDLTASEVEDRQAGWEDGRIAYLSGAGPMELTGAQVRRLREFAHRGGVIVSEALNGDGNFTAAVHRLAGKLFPQYRFAPLEETHPIYRLAFTDAAPKDLQAVDNGIRPLWIHSPRDVSLALELGAKANRRPTFHLFANLYLYLTDKGAAPPRGEATWPAVPRRKTTRRISLARVRHKGNCDPEPAAMERLVGELGRYGAILSVSQPLPWDRIGAEQYPVAYMTGTSDFTLSSRQRIHLKAYLAAGGTLLADAAGGSRAFADAFRREVLQPLGGAKRMPPDAKYFTAGPILPIRFRYRRATAARMSEEQKSEPRLEAVYRNHRPAVIFSPDDIITGLVGYPLWDIKGLTPASARAMMTALLLKLSPP
ncbi:MAG: DUF4159 domain-containing protein [Phycisphaerae bacterium]|nr:DUF4159 domain-containing protein [Phycisphaerae bacterium]